MNHIILSLVLAGTISSLASANENERTIKKCLFIGNSITSHAPREKLRWTGNWGMAATSKDNDFVHKTHKKISEYQGSQPELFISGRNAGDAGRITNALLQTNEYQQIAADLIVVQLGENEKGIEAEKEQFQPNYTQLLNALRKGNETAIIICMGVWHPGCKEEWDSTGALGAKDSYIKAAAAETKCLFVGTAPIGHIKGNAAWDQSQYPWGVKWHPGDAGMEAYAEAIFNAVKPYLKGMPEHQQEPAK